MLRRDREPPDPSGLVIEGILLASEGRAFPPAAVDFAAELARPQGAAVHVFTIARVHGVSFGLPVPGLLPTKAEWAEQRGHVAKAVRRLEKKGIEADGQVLGTRKATARICSQAVLKRCDVIVMAADRKRHPLVAGMLWSAEPYRVRRRSRVPVYLVVEEEAAGGDGDRPTAGRADRARQSAG